MKNKKLLYILITIITFFSYNLTVNAAQELTCVYEKKDEYSKKVMLVQNANGTRDVYLNDNDVDKDASDWQKATNYNIEIFYWDDESYQFELRDKNYELTACPVNHMLLNSPSTIREDIDRNENKNLMQFMEELHIIDTSITAGIEYSSNIPELTCIYEGKGSKIKSEFGVDNFNVTLFQNSKGEKSIYTNSTTADINAYWGKFNSQYTMDFSESRSHAQNNILVKCPMNVEVNFPNNNKETEIIVALTDYVEANNRHLNLKFPSNKDTNKNRIYEINNLVSQPQYSDDNSWLIDIKSPYTAACKYEKTIDVNGIFKKHTIQLNIGKNKMLFTEYNPWKGTTYSGINYYIEKIKGSTDSVYTFNIDKGFSYSEYLKLFNYNCPAVISVDGEPTLKQEMSFLIVKTDINTNGSSKYYLVDVNGKNPETGETLTLDGINPPIIIEPPVEETCEELLGEDIIKYINIIWNIIKIGIPIILIGLGTLDFVQAIFSGKEDGMKKAQSKFIKRIFISVVIFLVPTLLKLLLDIADGVWGDFGTDLCNLIF